MEVLITLLLITLIIGGFIALRRGGRGSQNGEGGSASDDSSVGEVQQPDIE